MYWLLVFVVHNRATMCASSLNFVGLTEKREKTFNVLEFERKKTEEIKE